MSSEGIQKTGYRPIDINVSCGIPSLADRTVVVEINPNNSRRYGFAVTVRCTLEISEGASRVQKRILVPQMDNWSNFQLKVYDDGELVDDMSGYQTTSRTTSNGYDLTEAAPGWLVIEGDDLDSSKYFSAENSNWVSNYCGHLNSRTYLGTSTNQQVATFISSLPTIGLKKANNLPDRWQEYSCYDIVVASFDSLRELAQSQPDKWNALDTFVRSGGNLIVYGVGNSRDDFTNLPQLSRLLDASTGSDSIKIAKSWRQPNVEDYGQTSSDFFKQSPLRPSRFAQNVAITQAIDVSAEDSEAKKAANPSIIEKPRFRLRTHFMGMVVAISDPAPFTGSERWDWIMSSLDAARWQWYQRHGLSQRRINNDFWNLMIPGVEGLAPITFFLILISLFVLGIGPINYWLLKRANRLYLLLFTVPTAAMIVTLGLLAYVFLADGIQTTTRIRSFTYLNSNDGKMTSWSRQMYHAALKPSSGLSFPESALVYPMDFRADEYNSKRFLIWGGGQAHLFRGFIQSRTLTQFLVVNAAETDIGLGIVASKNEVSVQNNLGIDISSLLVAGTDQQLFVAEEIKVGKNATARPCSLEDARNRFRALIINNQPKISVELRYQRLGRRYYQRIDEAEPLPVTSTSLLEQSIDELMLATYPEQQAYYAISKSRPSSVPKGIETAQEKAGFHVIKGNW